MVLGQRPVGRLPHAVLVCLSTPVAVQEQMRFPEWAVDMAGSITFTSSARSSSSSTTSRPSIVFQESALFLFLLSPFHLFVFSTILPLYTPSFPYCGRAITLLTNLVHLSYRTRRPQPLSLIPTNLNC